jgi:hypothetical protein
MAIAAQAVGRWFSARGGPQATDWLARSVRHMELLGAAQDARSIRVLLDVQRALAGDADAEHRCRSWRPPIRPTRPTPGSRTWAWPGWPGNASATTRRWPATTAR